jgi:hypothetical protein
MRRVLRITARFYWGRILGTESYLPEVVRPQTAEWIVFATKDVAVRNTPAIVVAIKEVSLIWYRAQA